MTNSNSLTKSPTEYFDAIIADMRRAGRLELIHYAGAAHRDRVAWYVTMGWCWNQGASEEELKATAVALVYGV